MMNQSRTRLAISAAIATALVTLSVPGSAVTVQYRVSGTACRSNFVNLADATVGLKTAVTSVCPIPTGPNLVNLTGSTNKLSQIYVSIKNELTSAQTITADIVIHDDASASFCTCGSVNSSVAASAYKTLGPGFSCGTCTYDASWTANARLSSSSVPLNGAVGYSVKSLIAFVP
jgi:hypothetical protein